MDVGKHLCTVSSFPRDFFCCNYARARCVSTGAGGVVGIVPLEELFLHEARPCTISQKGVAHRPLAWRLQHVLFSGFTFMSFACACRTCVSLTRVCVHLRDAALLPVLPRQSWLSGDWPADRLPQRCAPMTPAALPALPWYPGAVTPLLHGGWQEGEDGECNWGVPEPTRAGAKQKGGREKGLTV